MALIESFVVFVVSLLVGGLGIYAGARVLAGIDDYSRAVVTAAIGAIVWGIVSVLFGWIPLLGPLVTLAAYLTVIRWRYRVGWLVAAGIALLAWVASLVVLSLLGIAGIADVGAVGVPGV